MMKQSEPMKNVAARVSGEVYDYIEVAARREERKASQVIHMLLKEAIDARVKAALRLQGKAVRRG